MTNNSEQDYIPIRELSALTGVNSVTIRAWERRYGLLKPTRTPKGHRLYSADDVELIKNVQRNLEQGIAISKIKNLIHQSTAVQTDENWISHGEKLMAIINMLNINKLENYLHELTENYPPRILWEYLVQPLNNELINTKAEYGIQSKQLLLFSGIQKQAHHFISSQSKQAQGTVLMVGLEQTSIAMESYFTAMELTGSGLKPILEFYTSSLSEVPFIADSVKPGAIILHGNGSLGKQFVAREMCGRLRKLNLPFLVTGNAAIVNAALLTELDIDHTADHQKLISTLSNRMIGHE